MTKISGKKDQIIVKAFQEKNKNLLHIFILANQYLKNKMGTIYARRVSIDQMFLYDYFFVEKKTFFSELNC